MVPRGLLRRLIAEALTFDPSLQDKEAIEQAKQLAASPATPAPINMVLHCPKCGLQHIDAPDHPHYGGMTDATGFHPRWDNPPHRSHLCKGCGNIWRPADVPTNGVAAVATKGKADSPIAAPVVREPVIDEMDAVASKYAHKMALDLECVLSDYSGKWWDAAMQTLGEYRSAMNAIHERESPTHMGEPVLPQHGITGGKP